MTSPLVSVILPVFNGGDLLRPSVESVLRQTFCDLEVIVVDDGSTDQTAEVLRSIADPRLRVCTNERNLGLTRSLNKGLAAARGRWIARQDADDLSAPDRLERQLEFLRANPSTKLLGTCGWRLDPGGRITGSNDLPASPLAIRWACIADNPFLHTSVIFEREAVLARGGYDERFAICQDFDLWSRIAEHHAVANLPARLVAMREHATSMTRTMPAGTTDEASTVLAENWARVLPSRSFTDEEKRLLCSFRLRFESGEWPQLRALRERLFGEFCDMHPGAKADAEVCATRARESLRVAYKFLGSDRHLALCEIMRALRMNPAETLRQMWTVVAARAGWLRFDGGAN